jgi:hypothetical protein
MDFFERMTKDDVIYFAIILGAGLAFYLLIFIGTPKVRDDDPTL